jgi:arylsulfatase A-like enzyme
MPSMLRRLFDSPKLYFAAAGLLLVAAIASQFRVQLPALPPGTVQDVAALRQRDDLNVVFILVDTLRADRLGAYGYHRDTSRHLDAMAREGVLFRNVVSQSSWTKASMASIWTGTLPTNNKVVRYDHVLPEEATLPAEILREAGYRTAGIWRNGWVAPNFGFSQGFEFYLQPKPGAERQQMEVAHPSGSRVVTGTDEDLLRSSFEFLDTFGKERFFLYLHFMDVHQYLYDEMAARFGTSYSDVYDQSIDWIDRLIGLLVQRLEEMDVRQNTIVVVASDHGESFEEHGIEGHARNLYSEVVEVPWIMSLPMRLEPGIVVEELVSNLDIWPTVLDLMGLPNLLKPDGRSLVPQILAAGGAGGGEGAEPRPAVAYLDKRWGSPTSSDPIISVTEGGKRLIWWPKHPGIVEYFHLDADPGEQKNLFDPRAPDADSQRLIEIARQHFEHGESPWGTDPQTIELDELRLNQLRALGYVIR